MTIADRKPRTVAVVGAGLVGTLAASMLAQRGWTVTLYEGRTDPRLTPPSTRARSINLALSPRGIEALRSVSEILAERVTREGVEMRGRMLHVKNESKNVGQDYGVYDQGEFISSISRGLLGIYLLDHVEALEVELKGEGKSGGSVEILFETKLVEMNLRMEDGVDLLVQTKGEKAVKNHFDLVIGGDGAYSKVRQEMMRGTRFNYTQTYARHSYLELSISPGPESTWSIEPNFLHIWPRGEFMLIALPNQDKSFTLTLFAPQTTFEEVEAKLSENLPVNPVVELFRTEFGDALDLMGEAELLKSWKENPKDGLITVECSPYHYMDKALLIGDAAHAMVPFYGQGMNCAFEDVRVLSTILDHFDASPSRSSKPSTPLPFSTISPPLPNLSDPSTKDSTSQESPSALAQALSTYTIIRAPSLKAIQQLAASNYEEMAHSVLSPIYRLRLSLDNVLAKIFVGLEGGSGEKGGRGGTWDSLYRMTTFKYGIAYEEVLKRRDWQGRVLNGIGKVGLGSLVLAAGYVGYTMRYNRR